MPANKKAYQKTRGQSNEKFYSAGQIFSFFSFSSSQERSFSVGRRTKRFRVCQLIKKPGASLMKSFTVQANFLKSFFLPAKKGFLALDAEQKRIRVCQLTRKLIKEPGASLMKSFTVQSKFFLFLVFLPAKKGFQRQTQNKKILSMPANKKAYQKTRGQSYEKFYSAGQIFPLFQFFFQPRKVFQHWTQNKKIPSMPANKKAYQRTRGQSYEKFYNAGQFFLIFLVFLPAKKDFFSVGRRTKRIKVCYLTRKLIKENQWPVL